MTFSSTAPAHPHATRAAVYPAFFQLEYYKHLNIWIRYLAEKIHIKIRKIAEKFTFEYVRSQKEIRI